jgi:hypothetical protein
VNEPKFNQNPWKAEAYNRQLGTLISYGDLSKGESIAIVMSTMDNVTAQANAALIAAAPEMYHVLIYRLSCCRCDGTGRHSYDPDATEKDKIDCAECSDIRAILTKATP